MSTRKLTEKYWRPDIALLVGALVLSAAIFGINAITLTNLREDTLRSVKANMQSQAIILAEEGDRSFKVLDMALSAIAETIGTIDEPIERRLAGHDTHDWLRQKAAGMSHVDGIILINAHGKLVNFTRHWPIPVFDVNDHDYFQALKSNAALKSFVSEPIQNKDTGTWTVYLAHRLNAPTGEFMGLVLGAITLEHFDKFFRSIALQDGSAIALARNDGMLLARYPHSDQIGKVIPAAARKSDAKTGKARFVQSPLDRQLRIVSVRSLANFPIIVAVSQTEESALRGWRVLADHSTTMALARTFVVLFMAWVACRWWEKQRRLTRALSVQNARFDTALANMSHGLVMFDADLRVVVCNDRYALIYGLAPEQVSPGTTLRQIFEHRISNGHVSGKTAEDLLARVPDWKAAGHYATRLGDGRWVAVTVHTMANGGTVSTHEDITERRRLTFQLEQSHKLLSERTTLLQAIIDNFPGGIGYFGADLRLLVCNEKAKTLLDLPESLFANGSAALEDLLRFNAGRGEFGPGNVEEQVAARLALAKSQKTYEFERERPNGTVLDVRGVPVDGGGFITTYMDITERHRSEAKIAHMAHHDALTDLANRALLSQRLDQALLHVQRGQMLAIHLIDLDHFKDVNDGLGHPVGDKLLQEAAGRLMALARDIDTVARMGGDEFAVLQLGIAQSSDAAPLAERIIEKLAAPYEIDGCPVVIGASVGIAIAPTDGVTAEELLRNADLALYHAKGDGRATFRLFQPETGTQMQERRALQSDLRAALAATHEMELHYQPIVDIESRRKVAMEALVRWRHPVHGLISPDRFVPLAEEIGLIKTLGELVLRQACMDAVRWPSSMKVSVNLSPLQFSRSDLADGIACILEETGLAPVRLELEITESVLLSRKRENIATLHALRDLGISIALDDFGTGYSSLSYLRYFPLDKIKIDKSFVSELSQQDECAAIVCALANLGRSLGMTVTAEGVETEEQLELLRAAGCTEAQGYLFSRPCPIADLDFDDDCARPTINQNAELSPRDVMLVRASFARVVPMQDCVADHFYDQLFVHAPELRALFPHDLREQKRKLMAMLTAGVGKLHDLPNLVPVIKDLGARHAAYGTKPEHYVIVGETLLWSLEHGLRDGFTPEVRDAWAKVYTVLAETMQAGAAEVIDARAA